MKQSAWVHVKAYSSPVLLVPVPISLASSPTKTPPSQQTHPHPTNTTPREDSILIPNPSPPSIIRNPPSDLHILDPAVEAPHDVARVGRLFQVHALGLVDLLFQRGELLV